MSIQYIEYFYGAALLKAIRGGDGSSVSKFIKGHWSNSSYRIQIRKRLFAGIYLKYRAKDINGTWHFYFKSKHLKEIKRMGEILPQKAFIGLICGSIGVCMLSSERLFDIIGENNFDNSTIKVSRPAGCSFRAIGKCKWTIVPMNAFPDWLYLL